MTLVRIDTGRIVDWPKFHDVFAAAFGFPEYYGRNMNAWIDCLTYLDDPQVADTTIKARPGETVTLHLEYAADFAQRCPELHAAVLEGTSFVNRHRTAAGLSPLIALSFDSSSPPM